MDLVSTPRSSSSIILNTTECLEQPSLVQLKQQCCIPIFAIGPLHKTTPAPCSSLTKEEASCMAWLDKQTPNSVIYVSLGSIASVDEKELTEMAWGLANSKQPFLWVLKRGPPGSFYDPESDDSLPNGFKETIRNRGCIVKWAPQKEVLAHRSVGGFWSHCGWNSTLESISEGVPMICRPSFGDQRVNARYITHVWRVGFELESDLRREEIERAIKRLMVEEEGEKMRQRAAETKIKIEFGIHNGGSSYNSLNELVNHLFSP